MTFGIRLREEIAEFAQGDVVFAVTIQFATEDDVVEDVDLQQLSRANDVACRSDVSFGRTRIATRMVMDENDGGGIGGDGGAKNFAWVDENLVECALRNSVDADEPAAGVKH